MLIYVIRHGQTDWNAEARLQGQKNIPLNDVGRGQASSNGETLAGILGTEAAGYDYVVSPLSRARETMERIRDAIGLPRDNYRIDDRLMEISFGAWEGSTLKELKAHTPERVAARKTAKWDFIPPGEDAESYEILSWRVGSWLLSVDRPTVCVSHGGVIRSLFRLVGDTPKEEAAEIAIPQDRILKVDRDRRIIAWI
ncbi:histidine phosphatase family protein [Metarhizobium album]|uniref:Histidine phosphatase family protein n=1 Tax=Metarhizobium album TaxID=2182425 RepID=A0A2U2DXJ3_9HYPH|nr:histidine phosphatase family protein [Rhizobium album]PWE58045.1 histidine phosphatase family protein [Rhizobium album]